MTLAEIDRVVESRKRVEKKKLKEQAIFDYNLANLIGLSIGRLYSKSNKYPSIEEAYPTLFDNRELDEIRSQQLTEQSIANFKAFADKYNSNFEQEVLLENG